MVFQEKIDVDYSFCYILSCKINNEVCDINGFNSLLKKIYIQSNIDWKYDKNDNQCIKEIKEIIQSLNYNCHLFM